MKPIVRLSLLALAALGAFSPAFAAKSTARAEVTFQNPDKFTDFKTSDYQRRTDVDHLGDQLKTYLQQLAESRLPDGYTLTMTFTDIDMAGDFEPWRGASASDIRLIRDIYPPRLKFDFRIADAAGATVAEGSRQLSDLNFALKQNPIDREETKYEKELLRDWLRSETKKPKKG